jgi:modulator of FtsH protease
LNCGRRNEEGGGMDAYATANWAALFGALLGAVASLTGLIFVGISINLTRILAEPMLPHRALQAVLVLGLPLMASILVLVPSQPIAFLGGELLVLGAIVEVVSATFQLRARGTIPKRMRRPYIAGLYVSQLAIIPYVIAGASLLLRAGGGLYWLVPGVIFSIASALIGAWVLLIEIAR